MTVNESTIALLGGVIADVRDLAAGHLNQMKEEVKEEIGGLKAFFLQWLIIAAFLLVGLLLTGLALAYGIAAVSGWPLWAGFVMVGLVAFGVARVLWKRGPALPADVDLVPETSAKAAADEVKNVIKKATDAISGA